MDNNKNVSLNISIDIPDIERTIEKEIVNNNDNKIILIYELKYIKIKNLINK